MISHSSTAVAAVAGLLMAAAAGLVVAAADAAQRNNCYEYEDIKDD